MSKKDLSHLLWRAAIKSYDPTKKLTEDQLSLLKQAARLAPTSFGMQPFKIYVVSDVKTKEMLGNAGYNQPQFTNASHIIVFASRTTLTKKDVLEFVNRTSVQRSVPKESLNGFRDMLLGYIANKTDLELKIWSTKQAYIALGMCLDVAAQNKIDTTPMEGFDNKKFDQILGADKEGYTCVVVLAAGFRANDDKYSQLPKVRKTISEFITEI